MEQAAQEVVGATSLEEFQGQVMVSERSQTWFERVTLPPLLVVYSNCKSVLLKTLAIFFNWNLSCPNLQVLLF